MIADIFKKLVISNGAEKERDRIGDPQISNRSYHVFIFAHGFQASSYDMRSLKNYVSLLLPRALCLCSASNENNTEVTIEYMVIHLANVV